MSSESASIFEVIKRGGWDGSLFTTFNATLPFYEDVVLRKLTAVGCRNNVLLMDRRQCALAYASEATRPRMAGIAYTLVPIHVNGAFHPKLALLAGKKRACAFVGSHNLTISGFGYNREVTNYLEMAGAIDSPDRNLHSQAWVMAREWVSSLSAGLPQELLESTYALDGVFGAKVISDLESETQLIGQHPGAMGLLDQIEPLAPAKVKRITVLGAFFDREGTFLSELARRWKEAEIIVGVDPSTVWMPRAPMISNLRFVDAGSIGHQKKKGYLHAKAIYFEGESGTRTFASGSANPSAPAWLSAHPAMNVETMLVRHGKDASACAHQLGMDKFASKTIVLSEALADIGARSRSVKMDNDPSCPPLFVGIADYATGRIQIDVKSLPAFDDVDVLNQGDMRFSNTGSSVSVTDSGFTVWHGLAEVRTLVLRLQSTAVARLLIHHPAKISHLVHGAAQAFAKHLLLQLGSSLEDISTVLPFLERIIFSDGAHESLRLPSMRSPDDHGRGDGEARRPESLAISLNSTKKVLRTSLFSNSSDLCSLLDIFLRRIQVPEESIERGVDWTGRSEEEQIGQDDEGAAPISALTPTDEDVAGLVQGKATKLVRRMCRALERTERSPTSIMVVAVQLVAVVALLRELAHLETTDRWRRVNTALVWIGDLEELLEAVTSTLLANGSAELSLLHDRDGLPPEEISQLRSLLTWLAWMTQCDWWTPAMQNFEEDDREVRVLDNAKLLELLRHTSADPGFWSMLQVSIGRTLLPDPIATDAAADWVSRHQVLATRLSNVSCEVDLGHQGQLLPIVPGDLVTVPYVLGFPVIAVENDEKFIAVSVGPGTLRRFSTPRVCKVDVFGERED